MENQEKQQELRKEFEEKMPFAGTIKIIVEAENEEQAKVKFHEIVNKGSGLGFDKREVEEKQAEIEWEFYEKLIQGNVAYVWNTEMKITELE
jgi:acyl-coenzyme A thioesterase PaaI-like protein